MLLQFKIYLITTMYFLGALFMICFPPRNFSLSGAKVRVKRNIESVNDASSPFLDYKRFIETAEDMMLKNDQVVKLIRLSPPTAQNRSVIALELKSDVKSSKPGILIIGALNAMAWGAPNAIVELAQRLLYDSNYQTPFFNDYDWYLVPMVNPDGLEFTKKLAYLEPIDETFWSRNVTLRNRTRPAAWHKNVDAAPNDGSCFGTNINRNFAYHWQDDVHKMPERCSQYYPGLKPFSSAEAQALRDYFGKLTDVIELAIHLHASYVPKKEFILFPWRYSLRTPSNFRDLQTIGEFAARQSRLPDGRYYEVHQSSNYDRVAGSVTDYISGVVGTDLVFLLKPYFPMFPNVSDARTLDVYTKKAISAMLSLVRGWRRSTKLNTLYFFGREVEF